MIPTVYEPLIRALLGTASHYCEAVVLELRTVPSGIALDLRMPLVVRRGAQRCTTNVTDDTVFLRFAKLAEELQREVLLLSSSLPWAWSCVIQKSASLEYKPSLELLLITAKQLFLNREL